nr:FCS-Like Zinc finger 10-like [Ipomoea batatas]
MLRKRTRSQKDQQMGHLMPDSSSESHLNSGVFAQKHKVSSFFNVPALFVGLNPKQSESDSVRSPTSPLEFRVFSTLNTLRSQRSSEGHQKSWGGSKVGLSIIDALDDKTKRPGNLPIPSKSKNIIFGPQMSCKTPNFVNHSDSFDAAKSLPKNIPIFPCTEPKPFNLHNDSSYVLFGIGDAPLEEGISSASMRSCSLDSGRSGSHFAGFASRKSNLQSGSFGTEHGINSAISQNVRELSKLSNSSGAKLSSMPAPAGSISTSEIELSEDYTCVRTHGPNPKVTHIFCDCILECHNNEFTNFSKNGEEEKGLSKGPDCCEEHLSYPSSDFLSFCYTCKKKLDGKDIFIYRGEKAFCSSSCRSEEILIDEQKEKTNKVGDDFEKPNSPEESFESSLFIAT